MGSENPRSVLVALTLGLPSQWNADSDAMAYILFLTLTPEFKLELSSEFYDSNEFYI